MDCWLKTVGYAGPGHDGCGPGQQGGHTAHHLGRNDEDGLLPVCGRAHDLVVFRCANSTADHFIDWLKRHDYELRDVGERYVVKARGIDLERDLDF
jgi:hypothetical protein